MKEKLDICIPYVKFTSKRLDKILSVCLKEYSRSCIKKWILTNHVHVNEMVCNQPDKILFGGELITVYPIIKKKKIDIPEYIPLNIVYEDNDILIINKPPNLVVHPGPGNNHGTLLNGLLYYNNNIQYVPRAGIIHRLDKNTSGLMIVAKTIISYNNLIQALKKRKIIRKYKGIVKGNMISGGIVNYPIMRHRSKRLRMMTHILGKKAITHYKIIYRFQDYTYISLQLETGRTHQIRVHMLHIGYPLLGDPLYRGIDYQKNDSVKNKIFIKNYFTRQALHASYIQLYHPITKKLMYWSIPLPQDMKNVLSYLHTY